MEPNMTRVRCTWRGVCCGILLTVLHQIPSSLPSPLPVLLGYFDQCLTTLDECLQVTAPGQYPVCGDCTHFLKCQPATLSAAFIPCPQPLLYDQALGVCNYPSAMDCTTGAGQTTQTTTSQPLSTISQTPTSIPSHSTTTTLPNSSSPISSTIDWTSFQGTTRNPVTDSSRVPSSQPPSPSPPSTSTTPSLRSSPLSSISTTTTPATIISTTADIAATTIFTAASISSTTGVVPSNDAGIHRHETLTNNVAEGKVAKKIEWEDEKERRKGGESLLTDEMTRFSTSFPATTSTIKMPSVPEQVVCNVCHEKDGFFGTCNVCSFYFWCYGGRIHAFRQCPYGLEWDDRLQQCTLVSSTCRRLQVNFPGV